MKPVPAPFSPSALERIPGLLDYAGQQARRHLAAEQTVSFPDDPQSWEDRPRTEREHRIATEVRLLCDLTDVDTRALLARFVAVALRWETWTVIEAIENIGGLHWHVLAQKVGLSASERSTLTTPADGLARVIPLVFP